VEHGILKRFVGISKQEKKVLAASHDHHSAGIWSDYGIRRWIRHRPVHLFVVLVLWQTSAALYKEWE
jgi:hypothetical protein